MIVLTGDYEEEEVARLCQLQHSEYGDFAIRATLDEYAMSFSEHGLQGEDSSGRARSDSTTSSNNGSTKGGGPIG